MNRSEPAAIYAVATLDTKAEEIQWLVDALREAGETVRLVDVSTGQASAGQGQNSTRQRVDISRDQVAAFHPQGASAVCGLGDRGVAIAAMSIALQALLCDAEQRGQLAGVIGIGGGGGTSLISHAMQALPLGLPKLILSTMASGDISPYIDVCDITLMNAVVDIAGLNRISRVLLSNAAAAMAGMVAGRRRSAEGASLSPAPQKPTLGMTMFGVTTPCVDRVRRSLEAAGYECLVFHATGAGGRAMEKLVASGQLQGVLDITTTEVSDEVVGGVLTAGPARFDAIIEAGIPWVLSLGAVDMVNFAGRATVPAAFDSRRLHVHNADVTLMRTQADECRAIAAWMAAKINLAKTPVTLLIPEQGLSALDAPGQAFYGPDADETLFAALEAGIYADDLRRVARLPWHINDPEFAAALVDAFQALAGPSGHSTPQSGHKPNKETP